MSLASQMPAPEPEDRSPGPREINGSAAAEPHPRPRLKLVDEAELGSRPENSRRTYILFGMLGISILFFAAVQVYVSRVQNARKAEATMVGDLTGMSVVSPVRAVYPRELRLSWDAVPGAVGYRLRIRSAEGVPVADPVESMGTTWYAPNQVIPGLVPGDYVWTVEALDSAGIALARSSQSTFRIRGTSSGSPTGRGSR